MVIYQDNAPETCGSLSQRASDDDSLFEDSKEAKSCQTILLY